MRVRPSASALSVVLLPFFAALLLAAGCGDIEEQGGSIFYVNSISGVYKDGAATNQVDVRQDDCEPDPANPPDPEYFSDHYTEVEFINRPINNSEEQTASVVYIRRYEILYVPLDQLTRRYPVPSPVIRQVNDTQGVPPCEPTGACTGTKMTQLYFVPIATKTQLETNWVAAGNQLAYNVQYRFFGANDFGEPVQAVADYNFYAANYDYCSE